MPVVRGHAQECPRLAVGKHQPVLEIFPPRMHVRMQGSQRHFVRHFKRGIHAIIRIAGRNLERSVHRGKSLHSVFRHVFRQDQSEFGAVHHRLSVRRVMHFEYDV